MPKTETKDKTKAKAKKTEQPENAPIKHSTEYSADDNNTPEYPIQHPAWAGPGGAGPTANTDGTPPMEEKEPANVNVRVEVNDQEVFSNKP